MVSRINYYKKYQHPTSPTWLPYYKSTAFPTQIFRDLLIVNYERKLQTSETLLKLAMIRLMLRRLARSPA